MVLEKKSRTGLTYEQSAVALYTEGLCLEDREHLWDIIRLGVDAWECAHSIMELSKDVVGVVFQNISNTPTISFRQLGAQARDWGPWVLNLRVYWSPNVISEGDTPAPTAFCVMVEVALNGTESNMEPTEVECGEWRKVDLKTVAEHAIDPNKRPHDWDPMILNMQKVAHILANHREFVPAFQSSIIVAPSGREYGYELTGMDYIDFNTVYACAAEANIIQAKAILKERKLALRMNSHAPREWPWHWDDGEDEEEEVHAGASKKARHW